MSATATTAAENGEEGTKMVTLISSDGKKFFVTEAVAEMSQLIAFMIEDDCVENGVPLPNVHSIILAKILEYCNKHAAAADPAAVSADDLKSFDANFINVGNSTLFHIINAANFMEIKGLLRLATQTVADRIKGKTVEELRLIFNLANDFTPEQEEAIQREHGWASKYTVVVPAADTKISTPEPEPEPEPEPSMISMISGFWSSLPNLTTFSEKFNRMY